MFGRKFTGRRQRLAGVVLAVSSLVALAACSSATDAQSKDGKTTITLSMQNPNVKTADPATWAIVKAFEKANPDIHVEVSGQAVAEHLQALSIAAQSDTLPDVFWVYKATAEDMLKAGKLMNLKPTLDDLGITPHLPKSTVSNFTAQDKIYGVPYQGLLTGLWVNKKILSDNGLEQPTTFDDLVNVAKKLKSKGIVTISDGANQSSFSVWSFLVWLDRFGFEDKIDAILDGSESYDNADFVRMYEHIAQLRDAGAFASNVSTQTYQQAVDQYLKGKAAMLDAGVWASSAIQDSQVAADTVFWNGATFADGVGDQNIVMNVASAPLVVDHKVAGNSKKLAAVKKFLGFYYSDAAQQLLVDNGQPPVTDYEPKIDATKQSVLKSALDVARDPKLASPQSQPDLLVSTAVSSAMYDSIYGVIQDQLSPRQAVDLVQKALDAE
ncbi:ABC transporter substrate-binding protein [Aeromicrobium ginsengisoli]|uniref:Carbohydrate ABC transporter substrate-binding protein n=1 Tax=Aeromicrobium ginsengisoli TaxID=363867 RepID=A0A5M4FEM2_9ACTN|nr:ABC transporter substrate-binding protein [Aeromicrobium ginsengisoli]KAA1397734.1 carbohydrate ABC transporter substrate-binding protein [Aeromicrobium ginsengisoli]